MRKLFIVDHIPNYSLWDDMWSKRKIEHELEACNIETAPRVMFLSYLPKDGNIIDAGCGFGKWLIFLKNRGYNIKGIDNNHMTITELTKYDKSLQTVFGDILHLQYPDNSFDAYISMGVVEHFKRGPMTALKEAHRILRPNGIIFLSTPTVNIIRKIGIQPLLNIFGRFFYIFAKFNIFRHKTKNANKTLYYHFLEYRFTVQELHSFLKHAQFTVLETLPHDFHGSKKHAIGLGVDFPFLKVRNSINFQLNIFGRIISRILDGISPWIACASVLCVAKAIKSE
jgi:SAM-dependent methyltransferase